MSKRRDGKDAGRWLPHTFFVDVENFVSRYFLPAIRTFGFLGISCTRGWDVGGTAAYRSGQLVLLDDCTMRVAVQQGMIDYQGFMFQLYQTGMIYFFLFPKVFERNYANTDITGYGITTEFS